MEPGSAVHTDEQVGYRGMANLKHESVKHAIHEHASGVVTTNSVESFWALLKQGYIGVYHQMSKKHLHRYVAELAGRHNLRPMDTADQMAVMARAQTTNACDSKIWWRSPDARVHGCKDHPVARARRRCMARR